jgi:hypothetical protein
LVTLYDRFRFMTASASILSRLRTLCSRAAVAKRLSPEVMQAAE